MSSLASRFGAKRTQITSTYPLSDDQIMAVAPSIFAPGAHESRSQRYAYIPTIDVLQGLRKEGFEPYMAGQSRCRLPGKTEFTKHIMRLRHASQVVKSDANEIVLLNSHDGTSSYQMLAGKIVFLCMNGLITGDITHDIRVRHGGADVQSKVIEGAYEVLNQFALIDEHAAEMRALRLTREEEHVFASSALALRYDPAAGTPPVRPDQVVQARRREDADLTLWNTFNRAQENLIRGGLPGRSASGRNTTTREITSIDNNVVINRGLWMLAEGMRRLKNGEAA